MVRRVEEKIVDYDLQFTWGKFTAYATPSLSKWRIDCLFDDVDRRIISAPKNLKIEWAEKQEPFADLKRLFKQQGIDY